MTSDAAHDTTPVLIPTKSTMGVIYKEDAFVRQMSLLGGT